MTLTLRAKLALAFALVAALPLIAIERATARIVRDRFEADTRQEFEGALHPIERHFARGGERVRAAVHRAAQSYALRDALLGWASAPSAGRQKHLIDAVGAAAAEAGLSLLTLYGEDGTVLASAQEPERFDVRDAAAVELFRNHPDRPLLAREEGVAVAGLALRVALAIGNPLSLDGGSAPVETGERYWLAGGELVEQDSLPALPESLALVVADGARVQAAPTAAGREALRLLAGRRGDEILPALAADRWQVRQVELAQLVESGGTRLVLAASRAPLEQSLAALDRTFATLLLLGLGFAAALALLIARRWTEPIEELARGLERVARGDLEWRIAVRRDDELGRLVAAFHDMTRDLAESRERLRQAERVAAWQEIARRLAHEIKNPLSPIALSMETLRRAHAASRADFPEILDECTATVREEVERLRRIVQEFSDFARLPKPRLVEESLHEVVRGVVSLHAGLGDRFTFRLDLEPGEGRLTFDPDQMNRLLVNLVKNAIEAMPEGGTIRIATRSEPAKGVLALSVEDSGPGIPAAIAASLFEPYTTTKEGGTGLGLAIAHRIASEHGGTLCLVNPGEKGARFRLELPVKVVDVR